MQKVEGAVAGIGNIDNITSLAIEGQARVVHRVRRSARRSTARSTTCATQSPRSAPTCPPGIQEPVVARMDADATDRLLRGQHHRALRDEQLSWFVDNTITKRLLGVKGVAQVSRGGGVNREIRVELDPARMQALGITAAQVNEQLRALNLDSAGGRAQLGGGEQAIRVLGEARTARGLGETQIMLLGGRFARLSRHRQGQRQRR